MKQPFFDSKEFSEIKIFQIDKNFYELNSLGSADKIINYIVDKHRKLVNDVKSIGKKIPEVTHDEVTYYSYVYNETLKDSYWKNFLPSSISNNHNFDILKISFVLFACIKGDIFATVGGGGIRVLKRYINHRFGLEFFEYMTIPKDDIVISMTSRGISGQMTQQSRIFRDGRTLLDSLSFTEIPTKINLIIRDDLINTVFDFIDFKTDIIYGELGSYFQIKHSITFESLHLLFKKINEIHRKFKPNPISTFFKIQEPSLVDKFKVILLDNLRDDMVSNFGAAITSSPYKFDIDFIHPSNLQDFYECNRYELKAKGRKIAFFETPNRNELYRECLKFIYDNISNPSDQFEFNKILLGIRVHGYRDKKVRTHAMFIQHITCEIQYLNKPVFYIDSTWYKVKNDFIKTINERSINLIDKNKLRESFLNIPWDSTVKDEGIYNLKYDGLDGYYVFDKVIPDNIEFCDIMFEDINTIYLIHVKDGFDAKVRDVSNQITISANRFWNDFNSGSTAYLETIVESYNKQKSVKINKTNFINKFKQNKEIIYVMAYKSNRGKQLLRDKIEKSKSNIAKYSLIQCLQDMSSLYPLRIFDIADI